MRFCFSAVASRSRQPPERDQLWKQPRPRRVPHAACRRPTSPGSCATRRGARVGRRKSQAQLFSPGTSAGVYTGISRDLCRYSRQFALKR